MIHIHLDIYAMRGNRCFSFCSASFFIYLTATVFTLTLLTIFNISSYLNTIPDFGKKVIHSGSNYFTRYHFKMTEYLWNKTVEHTKIVNDEKEAKTIESTTKELHRNQSVKYSVTANKKSTHNTTPTSVRNQTSRYATETSRTIATETSQKERTLNCTACFQHNFAYMLNNENMCKPTEYSSSIEVIVLINSVHSNFDKREALRKTWLTTTNQNKSKFRYSFLLGMNSNKKLQGALETESATYNDIVQEDFTDTYQNLTLKTIMGFKWASTFCQNAKFVMKTDDDVFVNLPGLQKVLLKHGKQLQYSVGGQCRTNEGPIRSKGYKWFVPKELYPQSKYPGFCSGTGYVTSMSVAKQIYKISQHIPFFYLEDVYIGLCVNRLGMTVTSLPGFHPVQVPIGCNYKNGEVITSHHLDPKILRDVWSLKCNVTMFD